MVKTSSNAGCASSTSDRGDKIPHAVGAKKPKLNRNSIVTNSIETLKMIHVRTKSLFLKKKKSPRIGTECFPNVPCCKNVRGYNNQHGIITDSQTLALDIQIQWGCGKV